MDYDAGPSRPPPVPYDDPYSDLYNDSSTSGEPAIYAAAVDPTITDDTTSHNVGQLGGSTDDARPSVHNNRPPRGRGRGRGRLVSDRGRRRGRGRGRHPAGAGFSHGGRNAGLESPSEYSSSGQDHAFPPTPHYPQQPQLLPQFASPPPSPANWSYLDSSHQFSRQDFNIALQNQYGGVQPHINPRFANQLGFNFAHLPEQQTPYFGSATGPGHGESRDDMGDSGG
jgi:H/ACA ribonucleoprotein complex non-core subunit NAF1